MPFSKRNFVFIGIGLVVLFSAAIAYVDSTSIERPWLGMTCDEMIELAMSPEHQTFSEKQHIEFHKDLQRCIDNMQMHMGS